MNPERLTVPANDELVAFVDAMTEPEAPELTIEKLVGVYRVLIPHKIAAYTYHLNNTVDDHRRADDPLAQVHPAGRVRGLARRRDAASSRSSRPMKRSTGPRAHQAELEKLMLAAGGIAGPGSIGMPASTTCGGSCVMRKTLPVEELARDPRFVRVEMRERLADPRPRPTAGEGKRNNNRLTPARPDAPDAARALMHGIFVGEIQALEGAGRTCWDFTTGDGDDEAPFALKLDMARQCWDEARHVEISLQALRPHGLRDRRVLREHVPLRGRVQPRPGAAPHRREPGARRSRDRRVQRR